MGGFILRELRILVYQEKMGGYQFSLEIVS